jgi:hypothetical protein
MDIGSAVGRTAGVTESQLVELPRYQESSAFSPLEKLVIEYAARMTTTPVEVPETLFTALRQQLSEAQLVELMPPLPGRTIAPALIMPWASKRKDFRKERSVLCRKRQQRRKGIS